MSHFLKYFAGDKGISHSTLLSNFPVGKKYGNALAPHSDHHSISRLEFHLSLVPLLHYHLQ